MGLFSKRQHKKIVIETDLSACNHLPAELKIKILRAQMLMDEAQARMDYLGVDVSLPYKLQLKGDMAELDRRISDFAENRAKPNAAEQFELAVLRFQTEAEHILNFKFQG